MMRIPFIPSRQSGFTLVEMIVVIVITGIIAGIVALFITAPVHGYVDSARRAEMSDIADTALRRISRDIQTALPNTVRVTACGTGQCLEYLETIAGGRYKSDDCLNVGGCAGLTTTGDLVSGANGTTSTALTNGGTLVPNAMRVAVYNQYNNSGNDCSPTNPSAYCTVANGGAPLITGVTNGANAEDVIGFAATTFIPSGGSPYNRFQIISQPVTYACMPVTVGGTNGTLTRYWGYDIQPAQPNTIAAGNLVVTGATIPQHALLAENVGACSIVYDSTAQRSALVTMQLTLTQNGESLTIYKATHVSNVP
jgi:MSHA biogenesis protein MshO